MTRFRFWRNKESAGKFGFQRKNSIFFPICEENFSAKGFFAIFSQNCKNGENGPLAVFFFYSHFNADLKIGQMSHPRYIVREMNSPLNVPLQKGLERVRGVGRNDGEKRWQTLGGFPPTFVAGECQGRARAQPPEKSRPPGSGGRVAPTRSKRPGPGRTRTTSASA